MMHESALVTIFGGGGFLGTHIAEALLASGLRVRIASRRPDRAMHIKPLGGLGRTQFVVADILRPATVARALAGAQAAVNLVGILKGDFDAMHRQGAANVAAAAADAGLEALVHVSAIGADPASPSAYGRSKAAGEEAVRAAFPAATILRPSIVFGRDDQFVNRFAGLIATLPVVPVLGGQAQFQPVFVDDVAEATAMAIADPARFGGRLFELGGPEVIGMEALNRRIAAAQGREPLFVPVPDGLAGAMARGLGWLPGAPITGDQWAMLQVPNVKGADAEGLEAFGIVPRPLDLFLSDWMVRYRRQGRFGERSAGRD